MKIFKYLDIIYIIMNYNKFSKSNISKFGSQNINYSSDLTPIMKAGLTSAIPIWELLHITEEQYNIQYKTSIIDASNTDIFNSVEEEKKDE